MPGCSCSAEQGHEEAGTVPTGRRALSHPDFLRGDGVSTGSSHLQPAAWVVFLEGKSWQIPPGARALIDRQTGDLGWPLCSLGASLGSPRNQIKASGPWQSRFFMTLVICTQCLIYKSDDVTLKMLQVSSFDSC